MRTLRKAVVCHLLGVALSLLAAPKAVDVGPQMSSLVEADWIDRDARFLPQKDEKGQPARGTAKRNIYGVTTSEDASGGCDGVKNGRWGFHTASGEKEPWWQVDLGKVEQLDRVIIFNRAGGCARRTRNIRVLVTDAKGEDFRPVYQHDGKTFYGVKQKKPLVIGLKGKDVAARIVRLHIPGRCSFALDEIEVYAVDNPETNIALGKPADQKSVSKYSYPGTLPLGVMSAPPPRSKTGAGFALAHTRDVVERGKKLADRLRLDADPERLAPLEAELRQTDSRLRGLEEAKEVLPKEREAIYFEARRLVRKVAFCNPLLDFDKILFIKRHDPGGPFHMCDQYYGCNAKAGGALFVLSDPLGSNPKVTSLLEDSAVERGRLKGQQLATGSFLSPELSFDGKTILFAYSECQAKKTYTWGPTISYHIFKCNADGTGLVQLTDGRCDDFDPCFLPNGRIAFISLRRGGYLRCGRHCPTYALFSMAPDGSDIIPLSYHETHEWHPSVDSNGMLVYTRWDYVDRDTNVAHHIWLCYPDGRDARSYHGNYPERRESRPWMEMSIRAIPGSTKYVAVTGAHHGHAFGSLVLIDHRLEDDGAVSQIEQLTPEVPFPEAKARPTRRFMCYGTPWPLSEDDYLCVYDAHARNRGIYWVDRHGNRELLFRDPAISCLSPIPLRPRQRPPVIPEGTTQTAAAGEAVVAPRPETIAVVNVYDGDFEWPAGTNIKALRIIQVLPKTTAPPNRPRIGVANQTNARAVLGTVPVEPDGSTYFRAPAGKLVYFQALDERGLAVQSMRSATYVHPGERLTCQGCHEHKHTPPNQLTRIPLAFRRAPSEIEPDVDGSAPFNYPRLVQPVLDRNCVECHVQKKALDLRGVVERGFTRSYNSLAKKYGFYFHVSNGSIRTGVHGGSRTIAGKFGAHAAPLLKYLDERHYGVKLSQEDFHRLTLWLDCNSEFYGAYENTVAQAKGQPVTPSLQ